jgi:hypothetical protein
VKKPIEPHKPWEPCFSPPQSQVREVVGPVEDESGGYDEPYYPPLSIGYIEEWARTNDIEDPKTVQVYMHPSSREIEMVLEGNRVISQEEIDQAQVDHNKTLTHYREVEMPLYEAAMAEYEENLRHYYKWKHDNV